MSAANDAVGYAPDREAAARGGYAADVVPFCCGALPFADAPWTRAIEAAYRPRSWIEEHFRDAKSGLGLDRLRVKRARRIERLLIVAAVAVLVGIAVGLGWRAEHGAADPPMSSHKRGQSLSALTLGCELIWALMLGPLPLSLLDRPMPLAAEKTL